MVQPVVGHKKETPYTNFQKIEQTPSRLQSPTAQGILAARRTTLVTLRLLDGSVAENLRLTKGVLYEIEFREVLNTFPSLSQSELWAFFLPKNITRGFYV